MNRRLFKGGSLNRIGSLVDESLDEMGLRHRLTELHTLRKWADVVGPQIASATVADNIRDGILFICCKSSAWANELTLHKPDIIKRLNAAVGKKIVEDIRFTSKGYRKAAGAAQKDNETGKANGLNAMNVLEEDIEAAERAASVVSSEELAERIKKAIITSKKREKLLEEDGG